jgi:uncharacterized protein YndB with AHSA1/START domain
MKEVLMTKNSITINAPAAKVWAALTKPDQIKQWFFGVDTQTDWRVGSPIVHKGEYQGKAYEDKGKIIAFEPQKRLTHSHWSPVSGLPDAPENYQNVTYSLDAHDGKTELTVTEVNLPSEEGKATSEKSWTMVLEALKKMLEK